MDSWCLQFKNTKFSSTPRWLVVYTYYILGLCVASKIQWLHVFQLNQFENRFWARIYSSASRNERMKTETKMNNIMIHRPPGFNKTKQFFLYSFFYTWENQLYISMFYMRYRFSSCSGHFTIATSQLHFVAMEAALVINSKWTLDWTGLGSQWTNWKGQGISLAIGCIIICFPFLRMHH